MKILYLDCQMGVAGDMLTAALLELLPEPEKFIAELNRLGIPGVRFARGTAVKCGITGTHVSVTVDGEEEASEDVHNGHYPGGHIHEDVPLGGHAHDGHPHDHIHDDHYPSDFTCDDHSHDDFSSSGHPHEEHFHEDHYLSEHTCGGCIHDNIPLGGHIHDGRSSEDIPLSDHIPGGHIHEDVPPGGHIHDGHPHDHIHDDHYPSDHPHNGHSHDHPHSGLHDIEHIVRDHLRLPPKVRDDVLAVYKLIAEAESHVHGRPVPEIHFHEVGTMDAVADVTAVCLLMDRLAPDEVVASPVHVGSGQVRCAHGILPVPAPATAYILRDVPIYGGNVRGELCTPTGAALLKHFVNRFGDMPPMRTAAIGYGMGKKDFEAANCVRAMLGETGAVRQEICELSCNVDDMTAEAVGFAMERLFDAGALDVYTVPVGMKKSRPGTLIRVMCRGADREAIVRAMFRYTTTIGIRESRLERYVLDRHAETADTPYGPVRCKVSSGYGVERRKYEYEDLSRIAREQGVSIAGAEALVEKLMRGETV